MAFTCLHISDTPSPPSYKSQKFWMSQEATRGCLKIHSIPFVSTLCSAREGNLATLRGYKCVQVWCCIERGQLNVLPNLCIEDRFVSTHVISSVWVVSTQHTIYVVPPVGFHPFIVTFKMVSIRVLSSSVVGGLVCLSFLTTSQM